MEIDVKKIAADLGVILGVMLFMLNAIFYIVDIELFLNPTVSLYSLFFVIAFGCYSIINSRKKLGGYINWSDSFVSYMVCIAIGMSIAALTQIFIFLILDPVATEKLNEMSLIMIKETYSSMGVNEELLQQVLIEAEKNPSFSFKNITLGLAVVLLMHVIIGAICALITLIFNRNNPEIA